MTERRSLEELVAIKNKQRLALRKEYWKQITNPHSTEPYVFDPAMQRFLSMKVTRIEHFKETPVTVMRGLVLLVLPIAATVWFLKRDRDAKEADYRAGNVAYRDRRFKFQ